MNLRFTLFPVCAALAGCMTTATEPPAVQINAATVAIPSAADARSRTIGERSKLWKDPYSIRDARAADPRACSHDVLNSSGGFVPTPAACMCVEANAKNSYGGYTGVKRTIIVFLPSGEISLKDGRILGFAELCQGLSPFPELAAADQPALKPRGKK